MGKATKCWLIVVCVSFAAGVLDVIWEYWTYGPNPKLGLGLFIFSSIVEVGVFTFCGYVFGALGAAFIVWFASKDRSRQDHRRHLLPDTSEDSGAE